MLTMTLLPSAARTATTNSGDLKNGQHRGVHVVIDITAGATLSLTYTIQGKDPLSGAYYTILASAALTGVGTTVLRVFPAATAAANLAANDQIPENWRVLVTAGNGTSATYSVAACLLP